MSKDSASTNMTNEMIEALRQLHNEIVQAFEEESQSLKRSRRSRLRRGSGDSVSVRDIHLARPPDLTPSRRTMLGKWSELAKALKTHKVFLQYLPTMKRAFGQVSAHLEESTIQKIIKLVELLTETVENHSKLETECCFVTLLELLSSYCPDWQEPSIELQNVWSELGQPVSPDTPSQNFRNMSYEMLMKLPWVPNTEDLLWICEIEDDESDSEDWAIPPPALQSFFDQLSAAPLPRRDYVNRVIHSLKDGQANIGIACAWEDVGFQEAASQPRRGFGKTTIAAMVASDSDMQDQFCVLWLSLRDSLWWNEQMSYGRYIEYLNKLCKQLSVEPSWPSVVHELEAPSLKHKREEERMLQAKRIMGKILDKQERPVIVILDQVWVDNEIAWFRFSKDQSFVVTAETRNLSVDWTLQIGKLTEKEALELFLTESGYPPTHVLNSSVEAKATVHRCGYHPLTIRTAARWFRLKLEEVGVVKGLEDLNQELSSCSAKLLHSPTSDSKDPSRMLYEVLDLMLSPVLAADGQPTKLMQLCLSSLAGVFTGPVPMSVVHLLWGHLFQNEPDAIQELGENLKLSQINKRVRIVSEALVTLGLVAVTEKGEESFMEIHHEMYSDYSLALLNNKEFTGEQSQEELLQRWHKGIVSEYKLTSESDQGNSLDDSCKIYAARKSVWHLYQANVFSDVADILKDEEFFRDRLLRLGWLEATQQQMQDCQQLKLLMENDSTVSQDQTEILLSIYLKIAAFLGGGHQDGSDEGTLQASMALHCVGCTLSESGFLSEAKDCFVAALDLAPKDGLFKSRVFYSLASVNMLNHDTERVLENCNDSMKVLDSLESNDVDQDLLYGAVLQKVGDAMVLIFEYRSAVEAYHGALKKLSSHSSHSRVDIGKIMLRKGVLHHRMGELDTAMKILQECIKWKLNLGERSGDLGVAYSHLGDIYWANDLTADAKCCFKQAIQLMESKEREVRVDVLYLTAGKLCDMNGDYEGCIKEFDTALSELESESGNSTYRHAVCWKARILMSHGDHEEALSCLDDCFSCTATDLNCLETADLLFYKGECCLKSGREDTLSYFEQSLEIRKRKLGGNESVIETLKKIALIKKANGDIDDSKARFEEALKLAEQLYGEEAMNVVWILCEIGELHMCMEEHTDALAIFTECLDVQRRTLGSSDLSVANTLHSLGMVYGALGEYDMAQECFEEALEVRQAKTHANDPIISDTVHLLGYVARQGGEKEKSLQLLLDALQMRESLKNKRKICATLAEIGHVHRLLEDLESAIGCYKKCIEMMKEEFGDRDETIGNIFLSLGHTKKRAGQHMDAIECYQNALQVRIAVHGSNDSKVAAVRRSLGIIQYQLGNPVEATHHLEEYVRITESVQDSASIDLIMVMQLLGDIYEINRNKEKANETWLLAQKRFLNNNELVASHPGVGKGLTRRLSKDSKSKAEECLSLITKFCDGYRRLVDEADVEDPEGPVQDSDDSRSVLVARVSFMDD